MRVIVVGAGKVGYYLAQTLMEHEHKPYVIEPDKELCRKVANNLDIPVINGDGTTVGGAGERRGGVLRRLCQCHRP